jgi:hypothetical protein
MTRRNPRKTLPARLFPIDLNRLKRPLSSANVTSEPCRGKRADVRFAKAGGMAEWSMAVVLKTTVPERAPGVRIPLPPPILLFKRLV